MATEIYRVKSGESLSSIARDLLSDINRWPELAFLNGIRHPYFIYPGQILELPPETDGNIIEVESTVVAPVAERVPIRPATVFVLAIGAALLLMTRR